MSQIGQSQPFEGWLFKEHRVGGMNTEYSATDLQSVSKRTEQDINAM